jgi:alkylated DNA repair dioxygenase AlkB
MAEGLVYVPEFITPEEEEALLAEIRALDLREAKYKDYTAKRRIASFGAGYDFDQNELTPAPVLPPFLVALRGRVAPLAGIDAREFGYAMVAEYRPGTQLGWHRDVPQFEAIAGISLAAAARMRFRAYPPRKSAKILSLDLAPRSAYVLKDEARWQWQHSIAPTVALRYSITFRTRKKETR